MQKEELLQKLSDYVFDMEDEEICEVTQEYIDAGFDPQEGILEGLVDGMRRASEMYEQGEYFVPELINCSDAMYASMEMLQNAMPGSQEYIGKAVIGVALGTLIMTVGYTIGAAVVYSTPEYAVINIPYELLQSGIGSAASLLICYRFGLIKVYDRFFGKPVATN